MKKPVYECEQEKCRHRWTPRKYNMPVTCPKCRCRWYGRKAGDE